MVNSEDVFVSLQKFVVDDFVTVANDCKVRVHSIGDVSIRHNINNKIEYVTVKQIICTGTFGKSHISQPTYRK